MVIGARMSSKNVLNANNSGTKTSLNTALIDVTIKGESLSHYDCTKFCNDDFSLLFKFKSQ